MHVSRDNVSILWVRLPCVLQKGAVHYILSFLIPFFMVTCIVAEEPWTASQRHPILQPPPHPLEIQISDSTADLTCHMWLRFYQNWLSVLSQSHCRMEPSCSNYAIQAIRKHGAGIGIIMTADRLIHELDEQKVMRIVRSLGKAFCPDPVSNNDFWWYK